MFFIVSWFPSIHQAATIPATSRVSLCMQQQLRLHLARSSMLKIPPEVPQWTTFSQGHSLQSKGSFIFIHKKKKKMVEVHRTSEYLFMYTDAVIQHCYYKNCVSISLYYSQNHPFPIRVCNLSIFKAVLETTVFRCRFLIEWGATLIFSPLNVPSHTSVWQNR